MSTLSATAAGRAKAAVAAAAATRATAATPAHSTTATAPAAARRSCCRTLLLYGLLLPLVTILLAVTVPLAVKYARLPLGQQFAIITNTTVINKPDAVHSRWRGPEYIDKYDRFFFQWWNFLIYDAETHDHWTIVYHTTKFSKASTHANYASASAVHMRGAESIMSATHAIPLSRLVHTRDWDLDYRLSDGSVPHSIRVGDDGESYTVAGTITAGSTGEPMKWNLTFRRVHGYYSGLDSEEGNHDSCAIVSTLFGYHSRVEGWIEEGGVKRTFGLGESDRYRAYAAGSWGCRLPSGHPAIQYPWTWFWLTIPGDASASPPRPDIGLVGGTARFQTNVSLVGDLYGGYATIGFGDTLVSGSFAQLHHNSSLPVPLSASSTDEHLSLYTLDYDEWTTIRDKDGEFSLPLVQRYVMESAHYRLALDFHSEAELYFRLPVAVESADQPGSMAVFSDFRACGVKTRVQIWQRARTIAQQAELKKSGLLARTQAPLGVNLTQWNAGGWDRVLYDGTVDTLNALEFAYQAPLNAEGLRKYAQPQKLDQ